MGCSSASTARNHDSPGKSTVSQPKLKVDDPDKAMAKVTCPVQVQYAAAFLKAARDEYVRGIAGAVGKYYDAEGIPDHVATKLDPFEDQIRAAANSEAVLSRLYDSWGIGKSTVQEVETTSEAVSLAAIRHALGLAESTPPELVARQGLSSTDLEIVRQALNVGPRFGLAGGLVAREAESRLRAGRLLPHDWSLATYAAGRFLEGGMGGRNKSTVVAYEPQLKLVVDEIQGMLDATYRKVYTRDRRGAPIPDRFIVREVQRVFNDQVWREYATHREELRTTLKGSKPTVPDGTQTMNFLSKRRAQASVALPQLDSETNEAWLFHGTTGEVARGIAENDFRLDLTGSNAGTLYGNGIYLAENATKADEYGEGPKGPAGEQMEQGYEAPQAQGPPPELVRESCLLLCRSALGRVFYCAQQRPDPDALQRRCLAGEYDSVLGDRLKLNGTFRELIVYHDDLVYLEYIIRYERVFFHERFAEIYSNMCGRKRAGKFKGPTKDEETVLRSMWNVYGMPNKGKINKWQLLDLLKAIKQPPQNEREDLDATFAEWDTNNDGWIDGDEFIREMTQRVQDGMEYYQQAKE